MSRMDGDWIVMNARKLPAGLLGFLMVSWCCLLPAADSTPMTSTNRASVLSSTNASRNSAVEGIVEGAMRRARQDVAQSPRSPWTEEVVKLAQAGIDDLVIAAYIDNTPGTFNLGADDIARLHNMEMSGDLVSRMLQHDADVASGLQAIGPSTVPAVPQPLRFVKGEAKASAALMSDVTSGEEGIAGMRDRRFSDWSERDPQQFAESGDASSSAVLSRGSALLYPVREPNPEEITVPILYYQAWSRPANTLVISFSP
jgi:hypothetical protein